MNNLYYYLSTLLLYSIEATLAILVSDVTVVFDFVAALCVTCIGFGFPAVFFITAHNKYGQQEKDQEKITYRKSIRKWAYFHGVLAVIVCIVCLTNNIIGLISGEGGGH